MFRKFIVSFILATFGFLLSNPIVAVGGTGSDITVLSARYSDICSTNITCEKALDGTYHCSDAPESMVAQGTIIHQISSGKINPVPLLIYSSYLEYLNGDFYRSCGIIGAQVEEYVYPFVRITKIQV